MPNKVTGRSDPSRESETPIGTVTGLASNRQRMLNKATRITKPKPKKHPRNKFIDDSVKRALGEEVNSNGLN